MTLNEIQTAIKNTINRMKRRKQKRSRYQRDLDNLQQNLPLNQQDLGRHMEEIQQKKVILEALGDDISYLAELLSALRGQKRCVAQRTTDNQHIRSNN